MAAMRGLSPCPLVSAESSGIACGAGRNAACRCTVTNSNPAPHRILPDDPILKLAQWERDRARAKSVGGRVFYLLFSIALAVGITVFVRWLEPQLEWLEWWHVAVSLLAVRSHLEPSPRTFGQRMHFAVSIVASIAPVSLLGGAMMSAGLRALGAGDGLQWWHTALPLFVLSMLPWQSSSGVAPRRRYRRPVTMSGRFPKNRATTR